MIPSKHARSLYFTPRTPWGRYPQNRPAQSQNYLRASEDEKRELSAQPADFERAMDKNNVPRSLQSMPPSGVSGKTPSAFGEDPDGLPFAPWHSPIRQGTMDPLEEQEHDQRAMDDKGVPRSLQGQIIPQRAGEVTNPFQKPVPGLTDDVFQPPSQKTSPTAAGSRESAPTATKEQMDEQARRWGGYQQAIPKPEPKVPEPPLNIYWGKDFKGVGKTFHY